MKNDWKALFAILCTVLCLGSTVPGEEMCPVEIKLLLSPPTIRTVIASIGFEKETTDRIYFFDTKALSLQMRGVILRVRQGANNDVTVKVRVPGNSEKVDTSRLSEHFPCEIDRTPAGDYMSYAVRRKHKSLHVPETGTGIFKLLSPSQTRLLEEARISIDWTQVSRIADIKSTKWETTGQASFFRLALEMWESPAGDILELSTKVGPHEGQEKYAELEQLVNEKN